MTADRSKGLPSVCAIITAFVLPGRKRLQLFDARVERERIVVNENRHAAVLNNGRDGGGKTGGDGDDFIAGV